VADGVFTLKGSPLFDVISKGISGASWVRIEALREAM